MLRRAMLSSRCPIRLWLPSRCVAKKPFEDSDVLRTLTRRSFGFFSVRPASSPGAATAFFLGV